MAKAQRGKLTFTLPPGLSWTPDGTIERHPDRRVQQAIGLVFAKLSEFGSVRQVLMWLREENVSLPSLESERPRAITWRRPTYRMVRSSVRSPFYAGAYAFGRRESRTRVVEGRAWRTSGHQKPMDQWTVFFVTIIPGTPGISRGSTSRAGAGAGPGGRRWRAPAEHHARNTARTAQQRLASKASWVAQRPGQGEHPLPHGHWGITRSTS